MSPRQPSRPDRDPPGNGGNDPDLGQELERCALGDDCPYAGSMRWLADERLRREQVQGELAATVDRFGDEVRKCTQVVEGLKGKLLELEQTVNVKVIGFDATLKAHTRNHRWIEMLVMGLAMGFASVVTRWFQK